MLLRRESLLLVCVVLLSFNCGGTASLHSVDSQDISNYSTLLKQDSSVFNSVNDAASKERINSSKDSLIAKNTLLISDSLLLKDSLPFQDSLPLTDSSKLRGSLLFPAFSGARDSIVEDFSDGKRVVYYYGDVTVKYGSLELKSDYMAYDMDTKTVFLWGCCRGNLR